MNRTRDLPLLNETMCTACRACVLICPTRCLVIGGRLPWLPRPLDCVACRLCEVVCPEGAIKMSSITPA